MDDPNLTPISEEEALKAAGSSDKITDLPPPAAPTAPVASPGAAPDHSNIPDLPAGVNVADLEPVSESTARGKYVDHEGKPLARFRTMDEFQQQFTSRLRSGEINDQNEAQAFADDFAPVKTMVDARSTIAERDKGAHVTDETVDDNTVTNWIQHLRSEGHDTSQIEKLPVQDQLKLANADFQKQVAAYLQEHIPEEEKDPAKMGLLQRLGMGTVSSTGDLVDAAKQAGYRLADVLGALDHAKAETGFDAVAWDNKVRNAALVRGRAGEVGKFAGEVLQTGIVPMAASERAALKFPRLANFVTRSLGGAAIGAMEPSDNYDQQAGHILTNMATTPLMIPIVEKLGAKLGQAGMSAYLGLVKKYTDQGVGAKLLDKAGNFTPMGRALEARFIGAGAPPAIARQTVEAVAKHNPAEIASDVATPIEAIAAKENVPLTTAAKTDDTHAKQVVETAGKGTYGNTKTQNMAIASGQAADDALVGNVEKLGSGQTGKDAANNAAEAIHTVADNAATEVGEKYKKLETAAEPLSREGQAALKANLHDTYDELGQGGVDTLTPVAKNYATRMNALTESKRPPRFGEVWKLSRQMNADARAFYGSPEGVNIGKVKTALDNWMENADPSHMAKGGSGVFRDLTSANSDYKALMDKFGNRPDRIRGGGMLQDKTGKAVANIVALVKQTAPDGVRAGQDISADVARHVFGNSDVLTPDAANIITHISKVAPEAIPHILDMWVGRTVKSVTKSVNGRTTLNIPKYRKVIEEPIENSRPGLKAMGLSDADVQSLSNNAWLAAKRQIPPGASNIGSAASNRGIQWGFRNVARVVGALIGAKTGHGGFAAEVTGGIVGDQVARFRENSVARDAISGTVPRAPNAGREVGATTLKALAKGALEAGGQSRIGRD